MKSKKRRWLLGVIVGAVLIASLPAFGREQETGAAASRFSLGAGLGIPFGVIGLSCEMNPILDADLHYIIPVEYDMDELEGGRMRFSAGLRYRL